MEDLIKFGEVAAAIRIKVQPMTRRCAAARRANTRGALVVAVDQRSEAPGGLFPATSSSPTAEASNVPVLRLSTRQSPP
jgi:hypothetical protein